MRTAHLLHGTILLQTIQKFCCFLPLTLTKHFSSFLDYSKSFMTVAQTKKKKLLETQPFLTTLLDKNNCVGKEDSLEEEIYSIPRKWI